MLVDGAEIWRATRTPMGPATLRLRREGAGVEVSAWGPGADRAIEQSPDLIGAFDDPSVFRAHHPVIRELHRRMAGLRLGRTGAVMEALVASIIEQKVTGKEAFRSYERLVRTHGDPAPGPAPLLVPPSPERLAALPYYVFHPLGIERRRADTIRRACSNAKRLEEAAGLPITEAYRRLRAVRGVGAWTAAEVARVALGDPDAVSIGDYHLPNLVAWTLAGEPRGDDARMIELLQPYRGQRARAIRLLEAGGRGAPRYGPRRRLRSIASI